MLTSELQSFRAREGGGRGVLHAACRGEDSRPDTNIGQGQEIWRISAQNVETNSENTPLEFCMRLYREVIINLVTLILSNLSLVTSLQLQWMGHFIRSKSDEN